MALVMLGLTNIPANRPDLGCLIFVVVVNTTDSLRRTSSCISSQHSDVLPPAPTTATQSPGETESLSSNHPISIPSQASSTRTGSGRHSSHKIVTRCEVLCKGQCRERQWRHLQL